MADVRRVLALAYLHDKLTADPGQNPMRTHGLDADLSSV
jgi:hypothetical protein